MEFILGGYYLIQGAEPREWMEKDFFPPIVWSASHHICKIYPASWIFTWTLDKFTLEERKRAQEILQLDDASLHALQHEFDDLFNQNEFGFPNAFYSLSLARNFYSRYLRHLSNIKLLSIALPDEYREEFIQDTTPEKNMGEPGIRYKLRSGSVVESEAEFQGFEVLGYDHGQFCSYICNHLEVEYSKKFSISLNSRGFIENYDDARGAAEYTMSDDVAAEPYLWLPWLISEYSVE